MKKILLFFLVANGIVIPCTAQFPINKCQSITINDGLSQGYVYAIYQDEIGYMWFCTKDGLNRYDGYEIKVFRNDPDDPLSHVFNEDIFLHEAPGNNLWIQPFNHGIDLFIREQEIFVHCNASPEAEVRISSDRVQWSVACGDELIVYSENAIDVLRLEKKSVVPKELHSLSPIEKFRAQYTLTKKSFPVENENAILQSMLPVCLSDQRIIGVSNDSLYQIDITDKVKLCHLDESMYGLNKIAGGTVTKTLEDKQQRIIFFNEQGACRYNPHNGLLETVLDSLRVNPYFFRSGDVDSKGNFWMVMGAIATHVDFENNKLVYHTIEDFSPPAHKGIGAGTFMIDRTDNWWMGTPGYGLKKYNPQVQRFHHRVCEGETQSFYAMSLNKTNNHVLVAGGFRIWEYDTKAQDFVRSMPSGEQKVYSMNGSVSGHNIATTSTGDYWLAYGSHILYYNAALKKSEKQYSDPGGIYRDIWPMVTDSAGRLWFGSSEGLCMIPAPDKQAVLYKIPDPLMEANKGSFIQHILEGQDGKLWLATLNGIYSFDRKTQRWQSFLNRKGDVHSISAYMAFCLCEDPQQPEKYLWAGMNGGGICRLDKSTGRVERYTSHNGLPNDVVYGILSDDTGKLWMSTNRGIACFQPAYENENEIGNVVHTYTAEDGLQSNEFNRYSFFKTADGHLMFGGVHGMNCFLPAQLDKNMQPPTVVITDIRLRNKSLDFGNAGDVLNAAPDLTRELTLKHNQNMLTIRFAALDYNASSKNLYRYKLEGLSDEWIDLGTAREATFTNLNAGSYVFTVTACNNDGTWNTTGKSFTIIVLPAWYQTWTFRIALVLVLGAFVYAFYRYRINQLKRVQLVRDRIARDLHDELGSTLSSISLYSDLVKEKTETTLPEIFPIATRISESSHRMMDSMSDIVWAINPENDEFINVIQRMRAVSTELCEAANIQIHFHAGEQLNAVRLDMEQRRNFYLIFREALNNALKYADAKNISVSITKTKSGITLSVSDDGKGFSISPSAENYKRGGNGLMNMKKRAEALSGKLVVESNENVGTTIRLSMGQH